MMFFLVAGVVGIVMGIVLYRRRNAALAKRNWKEAGGTRGRTARAAPEGTLSIRVMRANGTVEEHGTILAHKVDH